MWFAVTRKENNKLSGILIGKKQQLHVKELTLMYSLCPTRIVTSLGLDAFEANYT